MPNENDTNDTTPPAPPAPPRPTLAEASGMTLEGASQAIRALTAKFELQNEENGTLRRALVAQQAMIEKLTASKTAAKFGSIPIELRHCNACGREVEEGQRCPVHKNEAINEIGVGMHHNRMQPIIIRQV